MHRMRTYFSTYLEKLEKQDKSTRVALTVAAFGVLLFFGIAITLPFRDTLFAGLFPKDPSQAQVAGDITTQKKQQLVSAISDPGPNGSCLDKASYALASLYNNTNVAPANNYIVSYYNDATCRPPDTASTDYDGYWSQVQMWRIYLNPTTNARLTTDARNKILTMMWLWTNRRSTLTQANRSPYTVEDSENHEVMRADAHLLALQALQDAPGYGPNKTLADGQTITEHYSAWLGYWMRYFQQKAREGINFEIASPIYAKYSVAGYYNVYDFTKSQALKNQAKNFLDLYWADVAQEFLPTGIRGGAETRSYKNSYSFNGPHFSLLNFLCIYDWYACTVKGDNFAIMAATSPYSPPTLLRSLARDINKPPYSYISRRMGLEESPPTSPLTYHVKIDGGSFIKKYSYITPEYVLGTLQTDSSKNYIDLNNQNRLMGVFFSDNIASRIIVIGKGTYRDTRDVGMAEINGIAGPNAMVIGRDVKARYSDGTQIFIHNGPLRDNLSPTVEDGWLFTRNGTAFVAIRIATGGYTTTEATFLKDATTSVNANGIFLNLTNMWSPVVFQLGRASDFPIQQAVQAASDSASVTTLTKDASASSPLQTQIQASPSASPMLKAASSTPTQTSFDLFKAKVKTTPVTYNALTKQLTYKSLNGDTFNYWAQSTNVATMNGDGNLNPSNTYDSPYIKQVHGQGITTVTYGGQTITLNTDCTTVGSDTCTPMNPDVTPPNVTITTPNGKVKAKKKVTIQATASDASGIARVEFYVENNLRCTATASPYSCVWDVPKKEGKKYDLQARAYDTKGNSATSTNVRVTSK